MNADRRKQLRGLLADAEHLTAQLEILRDEEQECYDNMPESLQDGERGQNAQTVIDTLESAVSSSEEAKSYIEEAMA